MPENRPGGLGEEDVRRLIREETIGGRQVSPQGASLRDPTPVGLAGFALTTFLFSIINAGWLDQIGTFIPLAFFYGGLVQLLSGIWAFRNTNLFGAVVFTSYGAFWAAFGFFFFFAESLGVLTDAGATVGFTLLGWTVFTFYVAIAAIKVNRAVFVTFTVFLVTLLLLDLGFLLAIQGLVIAGGYAGIILALCAWYTSAAGLINHTFERIVLPLGFPVQQPTPTPAPTTPPETMQPPERTQPPSPQPPEQTIPAEQVTESTPPEGQHLPSEEPSDAEPEPPQPQPTTTAPAATAPQVRESVPDAVGDAVGPPGPERTAEAQKRRREDLRRIIKESLIRSAGRREPPAETTTLEEIRVDAGALPIAEYDSLNMSQITRRLSGLSSEELERLRDYEAQNKNRRSLLVRFDKRIKIIRQTPEETRRTQTSG